METEMQVRELNAGDARKIAKILAAEAALLSKLRAETNRAKSLPAEEADAVRSTVAVEVLAALFERHEAVMWEWLASMVGLTPTELDAQPLSVLPKIFKSISESGEVKDFLGFASPAREKE
jgi:hypothetical protein